MTWVSAVRSSSIGSTSWISGAGRPSRTATTSGIDGICIACAIAGRGVDVDEADQEPALELVDSVTKSSASCWLSGIRVGE